MSFILRNINLLFNVPPYKFFIQHHYIIIIYMETRREILYNILVGVVIALNFVLRGIKPCYGSWDPLGIFFLGSTCFTNYIEDKISIKSNTSKYLFQKIKKFTHWFNLNVHAEIWMVLNGVNGISNCGPYIGIHNFLKILYPMMKNALEAHLERACLISITSVT